jgi:hypothetical protein
LFFLSEQREYVQEGAASPLRLISALTERGKKDKLKDIEVIHAPTQLDCVFSLPENEGEILYLKQLYLYIQYYIRNFIEHT